MKKRSIRACCLLIAVALARIAAADDRPIPALAEQLKSHDASERLKAARSLCRIAPESPETEAALPVLIELLKDSHMPVWYGTAFVLGNLGPRAKSAVPTLTRLLDDPQRRMTAAMTLGNVGPEAKSAVPALTRLLNDNDKWMRSAATKAITAIDPGSREPRCPASSKRSAT